MAENQQRRDPNLPVRRRRRKPKWQRMLHKYWPPIRFALLIGPLVLAGLGAKKLSMSASNMAGVKAALANVSLEEATEMALQCKKMRTEEEIKAFLEM